MRHRAFSGLARNAARACCHFQPYPRSLVLRLSLRQLLGSTVDDRPLMDFRDVRVISVAQSTVADSRDINPMEEDVVVLTACSECIRQCDSGLTDGPVLLFLRAHDIRLPDKSTW